MANRFGYSGLDPLRTHPASGNAIAVYGVVYAPCSGPLTGYQKRALANLDYVYPDKPSDEKLKIARGAADNAGRTFIENYDILALRNRLGQAKITGPGFAAALAAKDSGTPVLFVTGHYGNFEAPRAALVAQGFQIGLIPTDGQPLFQQALCPKYA